MSKKLFFTEVFAEQRKVGEGDVAVYGVGDEHRQQPRPRRQQSDRTPVGQQRAYGVERRRQHDVAQRGACFVGNGVVFATEQVRHRHHGEVAAERRPRASHVAEARHEGDVYGERYRQPEQRETRAPLGAVGELVPERQVVEDAEKEFARHDDRHHRQPRKVGGGDKILQDGQVEHDAQEYEQREDDEIVHGIDVCLCGVLAPTAAFGEYERLVGEAERLYEHDHDDSDFVIGAVDAQLCHGAVGVRHQSGVYELVDGLVHDAGKPHDEEREGIGNHAPPYLAVETEAGGENFGYQRQQRNARSDEVGEENVPHAEVGRVAPRNPFGVPRIYRRTEENEKEVQPDVQENGEQLDAGEAERLLPVAQVGERQGGEGVDGEGRREHQHVARVARTAERRRQRVEEYDHRREKERRGARQREERRRVDPHRVLVFFVIGEAEKSGFQPVGKNNQQQGDQRIEVGYHPVLGLRKDVGIEGYQTPVEKPPDDAAQSVNGGVFRQTFHSRHRQKDFSEQHGFIAAAPPQMFVGKLRNHAPARGALDETLFDEVGFVYLFERAGVFAQGGGDGGKPHRTALELVDDSRQYFVVGFVEAVLVDVQRFEGDAGYLYGNATAAFHLRKIAHPPQQGVGDTGRAAAA